MYITEVISVILITMMQVNKYLIKLYSLTIIQFTIKENTKELLNHFTKPNIPNMKFIRVKKGV